LRIVKDEVIPAWNYQETSMDLNYPIYWANSLPYRTSNRKSYQVNFIYKNQRTPRHYSTSQTN
jgi:hypothetical protein